MSKVNKRAALKFSLSVLLVAIIFVYSTISFHRKGIGEGCGKYIFSLDVLWYDAINQEIQSVGGQSKAPEEYSDFLDYAHRGGAIYLRELSSPYRKVNIALKGDSSVVVVDGLDYISLWYRDGKNLCFLNRPLSGIDCVSFEKRRGNMVAVGTLPGAGHVTGWNAKFE